MIHSRNIILKASDNVERDRDWSDAVESLCQLLLVTEGDVEATVFDIGHCSLLVVDTFLCFGCVFVGGL
jgi:hypothetical protein